jgi:hypothetical protein
MNPVLRRTLVLARVIEYGLGIEHANMAATDRTAQIPGRKLRAADRAADDSGGRDYQRFRH